MSALNEKWRGIVSGWSDGQLRSMAWKSATKVNHKDWLDLIQSECDRRGIKSSHPYLARTCSLCDKKALYRVRDAVFCATHKSLAVSARKTVMRQREVQDSEWEERLQERDAALRRIDDLRRLHVAVSKKPA